MEKQLGAGIQGVVFSTDAHTAVKAFLRAESYVRERDVYLRLTKLGIDRVSGFWVPKLVSHHDELLIVEIQIVSPPFVLDFASAYLDQPPPYADDEERMAEWEAEKQEQFEHRWPEVLSLMSEFRAFGIYLSDVKPGNITFADD